jgi:hypothetical protein
MREETPKDEEKKNTPHTNLTVTLQPRAVKVAAILGEQGRGKTKRIQHGGWLAMFNHAQVEALLQ